MLRGWGAYFRTGNASGKFNEVDSYVHGRLIRLLVRRGAWVNYVVIRPGR